MKKRYVIGIDVGATFTKLALVDPRGTVSKRRMIATERHHKKGKLIDAITGEIKTILSTAKLVPGELSGIGVGVPGLVDSRIGLIHYLVNIPGWSRVPLKRLFEEKLRIPVFVDNDVNTMALGELAYGAGRGAKNMICITLGSGVGGAIIIDGELYRGSTFSAGEIGHLPINEDGPRCGCGSFGCVERYVGNRYLVGTTIDLIKKGERTVITTLIHDDFSRLTPKIISQAARRGDRLAIEIWQAAGKHLGIALAGVVNVLNPEKIIIGGGMAKAGKVLFDSIKHTIRERAMKLPGAKVKVVRALLGDDSGIIGASVLVNENAIYGVKRV